jgi:hypothetical protein
VSGALVKLLRLKFKILLSFRYLYACPVLYRPIHQFSRFFVSPSRIRFIGLFQHHVFLGEIDQSIYIEVFLNSFFFWTLTIFVLRILDFKFSNVISPVVSSLEVSQRVTNFFIVSMHRPKNCPEILLTFSAPRRGRFWKFSFANHDPNSKEYTPSWESDSHWAG